jgi:hypothetical protein
MSAPASAAIARPASSAMTARALHRYAALDDRRRRAVRRGPAGWPPVVWAALLGGGYAAWVASVVGDDPVAACRRALALATVLFLLVLCGAPFRLFWRRDSALLARMPLTGRALYGLALIRSLAAAGLALVAVAPSLGILALADPLLLARHAALAAALAALAGLGGPAVALAAGALVASERAHAALASLAGEFSAPRTVWLGSLPALAGTALVVLAIDLAGWTQGGTPEVGDAPILLAVAIVGSLVAAGWTWARADRAMPGALHEVAALDRERLAHVDRSQPSPLERAWASLWLRARGARLVFDKDARLSRRRYPSPYAIGPLGVLICWGLCAGGAAALTWGVALTSGLAAYAALMAKRAAAALRTLTWVALAGAPMAVVHFSWPLLGWLVALALGSAVAAGRAPRPIATA